MRFSEFAVRRRVTVLMGVLVIFLLGAVSYGRLPIDLFPDFSFPAAAVVISYPGAAPAEVEAHVTRPIEQALATVTNALRIRSVSQEGMAVVTAEFSWGTSMDFAALEMREKVDQVRRFFPPDASAPVVVKFDPSLLPVMLVSITGSNDPVALRELGETTIRERLERLEGVAAVGVTGGSLLEVAVEVNDAALRDLGISWTQLRVALRSVSVNVPGGQVSDMGRDLLVRSIARAEELEDLRNLVVGVRYAGPSGLPEPVRLREVAQVDIKATPGMTRSRLNGEESLVLSIQKAARANTVQVGRLVAAELSALRALLPAGAQFEITMNQAEFINQATEQVSRSAVFGAGLAVLVLLLFLLNLGAVAVVALAIPVSIVATMIFLYFGRLSLNLMTLSGLALGVGMLVDNSIVVLENITRHLDEGASPADAAVKGTAEVATAISASTFTTLAVFLPVVFVGGIAGTLFRELAMTVSFALAASLLVAVTFVPMAASVLLRVRSAAFAGRRRSVVGRGYTSLLSWAVVNRWQVLLLAALCLVITYQLGHRIGGEFLPRLDRGEFMVTVQMPPGTTMERTERVVRDIETIARQIPEIRYVTSTTGSAGPLALSRGPDAAAADAGTITVKLVAKAERERTTREVLTELERRLWVPGVRLTFEELTFFAGAGFVAPVEVSVRGPSLSTLERLAEDLRRELAGMPGLNDVHLSTPSGRPEVRLQYDRDKLALLGLNPLVVADQVRGALAGDIVGSFAPDESGQVDIVLRYGGLAGPSRPGLSPLDQVRRMTIVTPVGLTVRLDEVATVTQAMGPVAIERQDGQRVLTLTAQTAGRDLGGVMSDVAAAVGRIDLPLGYEVTYGGEGREMAAAFAGLTQALWMAVILVYMVMAAQFESLVHPLAIMFTLPLAAFGATAAMYFGGFAYSVSSVIGLILLAGIVVNNAIVLVDRINQLRRRGLQREVAVSIAGRDRLRPILMTTLTTVLAMVPLALNPGEGAELAAPMAVAVIGGLAASTLLTLIVIPAVYMILDDLAGGARRQAPGLDTSDLI